MRRHEALGTIWRKNNLSLGIGIVVLVLAIGLPIGSAIARNIVAATLSASPLSIPQGTSATLSWSSSNAVACSGTGFSTGGAVSGTTTVLPSETTTYSVTCEHTPSNQATATTTVTTEQASASCAHGSTLPDGCPGAPQGSVQFSRLLNTRQVVMLNIVPGSKYTNGTFNWTTSGGGGSGASGTVSVIGGYLGGSNSQAYTIANPGSGYTSRPTIVASGLTGGSGGSITPTVYQATPHNAATPWNMPGVDYYVGVPSDTVLKDPTVAGNLPAGTSYTTNTVTIKGCNVTLNGFDFTLHATHAVVNVSGSNCTTTIENSKFEANGNTLQPIALLSNLGSGGSFVFKQNEYDGLAPTGGTGSGFKINDPIEGRGNGASISLLYNWFHNFDSKAIQISGANPSLAFIEKYNLFADYGYCSGGCSHGEAEYTYGGGTVAYTGEYNTYILHFSVVPTDLTAAHAVQADNMQIKGTTDDHNVVLIPGPEKTCYQDNQKAYRAAADYFDGSQNDPNSSSLSNVTFFDNYLDNSAAYFPWYHATKNGSTITNVTWTNNVDAGAGAACN
jgi:hypothetical protein